MLERSSDLPGNVVGLKASGTVTGADYRAVVDPLLRSAQLDGRPLRLLYELGDDFEGFSLGAVLHDARLGIRGSRTMQRCAIVSDAMVVRAASRVTRQMVPFPMKIFANRDRERAVTWLTSPPEARGLMHRWFPDDDLIVVKGFGPVTAEDLEALALTMDAHLERHGMVHGLVVRPPSAPPWDRPGSLLGNLRFLRRYRGRVRRLAVVADGPVPRLLMPLLGRWLHADVRRFATHGFDAACTWAGNDRRDDERIRSRGSGDGVDGVDRVDQAGIDSFPASDAPSFTPEA